MVASSPASLGSVHAKLLMAAVMPRENGREDRVREAEESEGLDSGGVG